MKRMICVVLSLLILCSETACSIGKNKGYPDSDRKISEDTGELYYAPIQEEHIEIMDDDLAYIDNEILVVAADGAKKGENRIRGTAIQCRNCRID